MRAVTRSTVGNVARRIIAVVIVLTSLVVLVDAARQAIDVTADLLRQDSLAVADTTFDTFRCVQAKIDDQIPPGAAIAIKSPDVLWLQRGSEGSYPRYNVTTEAQANYLVTIVPRGTACGLVDVQVSRIRRT